MNLVTRRSRIHDRSTAVGYWCLPALYFVRMQEREYREAILRDVSQVNTPSSRMKPQPGIQQKPSTSGRRHPEIRRPPSSQLLCHNSFLKVFRVGTGHIPVCLLPFMSLFPCFSSQWKWMRRRSSLCSWRSCHTCTSPAPRRAACGSSNSSRSTGSAPWRPRPVSATANSAARLDRGWDGFCRNGRVCVWRFCLLLPGQLEEAQRKHDLLVDILHKDQEHKRRLVGASHPSTCSATWALRHMHAPAIFAVVLLKRKHWIFQRELKEHSQQQKSIQNRVQEQRQQAARARKYYNDYHVQHRARLMRTRTKEEKVKHEL